MGTMKLTCRFKEAGANAEAGTNKVVLIEEGLGNMGDCFYYTKEAIASGVKIFEGKKFFADHPTIIEEETRPERSVKDVLGYFSEVGVEAIDGKSCLVAKTKIMEGAPYDWARSLLKNAVDYAKKYPDQDFVGLSINAGGDAEEMPIEEALKIAPPKCKEKLQKATELGITTVKMTKQFTDALSCDLVTFPGAGGKILSTMIEQEKNQMKVKAKEGEEALPPKEAPAQAPGGAAPAAAPAAGAHDDEQKDIELIKTMMAKHGVGEEEAETFKKISAAYGKMGMKQEEACNAAAAHLKASKSMQAEEAEEASAKLEKEAEEKAKKEAEEATAKLPPDQAKKEAELISLRAKNAGLETRLAKIELDSHMENAFATSKLNRVVTKSFREAMAGLTIKTKEDFNKHFEAFKVVYEKTRGESDVFGMSEKIELGGELEETSTTDFSDCTDE